MNGDFREQFIEDSYGNKFYFHNVVDELNNLAEENEKLKKVMYELKSMLQVDIDAGVRSYPLQLSEYLISALKKIGDSE